MRRFLFTFTFIYVFMLSNAFAATVRLSEPVAQDDTSETFGTVLDTSLPALNLARLLGSPEKYKGKPFQLETRISQVCQKKGCFFIAQQEQHIVRVSFQDYSFFIPTDSSGKTVILAGELIQKELSVKQAEHFNKDLKDDSNLLNSGTVYEIVANSVKIPRKSVY